MSHLTPRRTVHITHGGSAVPFPAPADPPAPPDTSWGGLIADLAAALDLDPVWFAAIVNLVATELAKRMDLEVARTRLRAALLGNTAMLEDQTDLDLSEQRIADEARAMGDGDADRVMAVLLLLHRDLVAPDLPPGHDDTVGEGSGGSAVPLPGPVPEPDVFVGQVAYALDSVPSTAKGVIAWIGKADTDDDRRARAQAAREVEEARDGDQRVSVAQAIAGVLDG